MDARLVEQAVRLVNFKTKQDAINSALAEFVARRNRLRILKLAGKIDCDPDELLIARNKGFRAARRLQNVEG